MSTLHVGGRERVNSLFAPTVGEAFNNSAALSRPEHMEQTDIYRFLSLRLRFSEPGRTRGRSPAEPCAGGLGQPCAPA